jgi:CubicO group peptidase (beta-lactamase class C family)
MLRTLFAVVVGFAVTSSPAAEFDDAFGLLEKAVVDGEIPGVTAIVLRDGKVARQAAYGVCDIENSRPFRIDTICWLASITKPVSAAAAMKLVEEGKLSLDDPIEKFLVEFQDQKTADGRHYPVTIRQLLTHTSGITQRPALRPSLFFEPEWLGRKLDEPARAIAALPLEFKPGERVQYSNAAPYVLGRIVELVSGRPFDEYVRDVIFRPLGMNDTYFLLPTSLADRLAVVYRKIDGKRETFFRFDPTWTMRMTMPDGGLFATTADTAKFVQAFLTADGPILQPDTMRQMLTEQATGFGLGWALHGEGVFGHDGSSGTSAWADPATRTVGVVFCQIQDKKVTDALQLRFREAVRSAAAK